MASVPFPAFNWQSKNLLEDSKYFKVQCTRYFKGPLKLEEEESRIAYILLWLNNKEFESVFQSWSSPVKPEDTVKEFWNNFINHFKEHRINPLTYRRILTDIKQNEDESVDSFLTV